MLFNLLLFFSLHFMVTTTALSPLYSKHVFNSFFPGSCGEVNIILDCKFCNESIHYIMKRDLHEQPKTKDTSGTKSKEIINKDKLSPAKPRESAKGAAHQEFMKTSKANKTSAPTEIPEVVNSSTTTLSKFPLHMTIIIDQSPKNVTELPEICPTAPKNETESEAYVWPLTVPEIEKPPTSVVTILILCSFASIIAFILGSLLANKVSSMWHSGSYDLARLTDMELGRTHFKAP